MFEIEALQLIILVLLILGFASIEFRLWRIHKRLKVLVPDLPPKPLVVKPSTVVTREEIRQKLRDEPEKFRDI